MPSLAADNEPPSQRRNSGSGSGSIVSGTPIVGIENGRYRSSLTKSFSVVTTAPAPAARAAAKTSAASLRE